jgi:hypothetical protein
MESRLPPQCPLLRSWILKFWASAESSAACAHTIGTQCQQNMNVHMVAYELNICKQCKQSIRVLYVDWFGCGGKVGCNRVVSYQPFGS